MKKLSNIKNVISKGVLLTLGIIILISVFWSYILQGFNLNTSQIKDWNKTDTILTCVGFIFSFGAAYFNRIIEILVSLLNKFIK